MDPMDSVDSTEVEDGIQDRASPSTSTRPRPEEGESVEKRQSPGLVLGVGLGMGTKQRKRKRIKVVGRLARTSRLCVESKGEGEAKGGGTDVDSTCTTMAMAMAIPVSSMLRDETPSRYETLSGQSGHDGHDGHEEERGIEAGSGNERRRKKGKTDGKGSSTPTAVSPGERAGERLMGKWETERKQERERKQEKEWKSKWKWEQASTDGLQPNNEPDGLGDTRKEGRTVEQGSEGEEEADVKGESGGIGESGRRGTKEVGPPRAPPVWSETRQELCESLPYFRAYQQGCYSVGVASNASKSSEGSGKPSASASGTLRDSTPFAYLLAGFPSRRDRWAQQGRVVVSHGGGKSSGELDEEVAARPDGGASTSASKPLSSTASTNTSATPSANKQRAPTRTARPFRLRGDQKADDHKVAALLNSKRDGTPIVLIVAEEYAPLPFKLNCGFAVLGWYYITDAWAEAETVADEQDSYFVRWKFRFEYLESQGPPWWIRDEREETRRSVPWNPRARAEYRKEPTQPLANVESHALELNTARGRSGRDKRERLKRSCLNRIRNLTSLICDDSSSRRSDLIDCASCHTPSPHVFNAGWMCLAPDCEAFWRVVEAGKSSRTPQPSLLTFAPDFLATRPEPPQFTLGGMPFRLEPPQPSLAAGHRTREALRGWHCLRCGKLSCREYWEFWLCSHCNNRLAPPSEIAPAPKTSPTTVLLRDAIVSQTAGIQATEIIRDGLRLQTYALPARLGGARVHVVQRATIGDAEADQIWEQYQTPFPGERDQGDLTCQAVPFKRHPLGSHAISGRFMSQQFTFNSGAPYKHIVRMDTVPLPDAPQAVRSALKLIARRTAQVVHIGSQVGQPTGGIAPVQEDFNELYSCGYFHSQQMNFHDDGEPGLGPIISSLSLGASATMRFRVKSKYLLPVPASSPTAPNGASTGTNSISQVFGPPTAQDAQLREIRERFAIARKDRILLSLQLRHGDVCVQEGAPLQKYFEHSVEPAGFRIAATARRIDAQ